MSEMLMISETSEQRGFVIDNDARADWALDVIHEAQAERDRLITVCEERIRQFEARIEAAEKDYQNSTAYLLGALSEYFDRVPHKSSKTQETYALPSGKLVYKKPGIAPRIDEARLLAWVKASAPEYVQVTEKTKWGELKKALALKGDHYICVESGEVVDGLTPEETPGRFEVK